MNQLGKVRRLYYRDGLSLSEIERRTVRLQPRHVGTVLSNKLLLNEKVQSFTTSGCILSTHVTPLGKASPHQLAIVYCFQKVATGSKMVVDD